MIDSFRAHSSFPPRSLAPALLYGLITETYSFSHYPPLPPPTHTLHPSLFCSTFSLSPSLALPSSRAPVYSSIPRKGGCQSPSAASPSSNPPHVPSSIPTSIHLSLPSITVTLFPPFSSLYLSHSCHFGTLFYINLLSFSVQRLPLFILVPFFSLLCIQ